MDRCGLPVRRKLARPSSWRTYTDGTFEPHTLQWTSHMIDDVMTSERTCMAFRAATRRGQAMAYWTTE